MMVAHLDAATLEACNTKSEFDVVVRMLQVYTYFVLGETLHCFLLCRP
jgi:hypothetical protein